MRRLQLKYRIPESTTARRSLSFRNRSNRRNDENGFSSRFLKNQSSRFCRAFAGASAYYEDDDADGNLMATLPASDQCVDLLHVVVSFIAGLRESAAVVWSSP